MGHRFVVQPYEDGFSLRDFLHLVVADEALVSLDVVVAWVKRTGVEALRQSIEAFRSRGGTFRAIAGISQGGTSKQGLALLHDLTDQSFVFHHPGRTFHPKVYAASGDDRGLVFVGSHNFTRGGVAMNYEAATLSDLNMNVPADRAFHDDVAAFVERLIDDTELCRPLDLALIAELDANPRYRLSDEDAPGGAGEPFEDSAPGGHDDAGVTVFGASKNKMRSPPPAPRKAAPPVGPAKKAAPPVGPAKKAAPPLTATIVKRWFKTLPASDAQQLLGSNPSNTMTLVQARHPIDASEYFRDEFFAGETWTTSETLGRGQAREVATIECEVIVRGIPLGMHVFDVRHTPGYDADQANRTTELAWREFGDYLRSHPLTGAVATLEKTAAGHYRLTIDDGAIGSFLY